MKVIDTWTQDERWSAYDTDTFYYAKVEHEGEIHTIRRNQPVTIEEILEELSK